MAASAPHAPNGCSDVLVMNFGVTPVMESSITYNPVGRCIYCGANDENLTRKHIIPFGLGGSVAIKASGRRSASRPYTRFTCRTALAVAWHIARTDNAIRICRHADIPRRDWAQARASERNSDRLYSAIYWVTDMAEYIFLMHDDALDDEKAWESYVQRLKQSGCFQGGSAIGAGLCARKNGTVPSLTAHLTGYIRVNAESLDHAKSMLAGNPLFEAGGTVEIRELKRTD
jgi:hypothetical protein